MRHTDKICEIAGVGTYVRHTDKICEIAGVGT